MKASVPGSAGMDRKLIVASKNVETPEYYFVFHCSHNPADIATEYPTVQMVLMRTTALSSQTLATFITSTGAAMTITVLTSPRYLLTSQGTVQFSLFL